MSGWLSDRAVAKLAALDEKLARGETPTFEDYAGILEPRVKPMPAECCVCCGTDARDECGGETHGGSRWCSICVGRGHHEDVA